MKREIDPFAYAGQICHALSKGILMTTRSGDTVNTMTIGWGTMGIEWKRPVFVAYVRESRYTKQMLEENGEFTVNVPVGTVDPKILGICGTKSRRDTDKISQLGLTLEDPLEISVPGIRELPLTLECRVIYKQAQEVERLPQEILNRFYPEEERTLHPDSDRDYHICYYGEILKAYIIE